MVEDYASTRITKVSGSTPSDCIPKRCPGCPDGDLIGWDEAPRVVDTEPAPQATVVTVAVQSCSLDTATEDELAEVASAWVGDLLAQPVSDVGGAFVHSPWNSLVFLPRDLSEEPPAALPAVLLSAGLEWESLGAVVSERGARPWTPQTRPSRQRLQ